MTDEPNDEIWCALASPVRRRILDILHEGPRTTGALAEAFPRLSRFAVMQHLEVLTDSGLVLVRREGRQRFNHANVMPLRVMYERWMTQWAEPPAAAMLSLERYLERRKEEAMPSEAEPTSGAAEASRIVKIELEYRFKAPIERVFAALTTELDAWWAFRFKPESTVVVEPWVGGRIYEDWGNGNGALYGEIVYLDPPHTLCSRGPGGVAGNYSTYNVEKLEQDGEYTVRKLSLRIWGEVPDEVEKMFTQGTKAIAEQLLRAYVEEGKGYRELPPAP
jgi:DNA-binding transcriptional ArsR family regulator